MSGYLSADPRSSGRRARRCAARASRRSAPRSPRGGCGAGTAGRARRGDDPARELGEIRLAALEVVVEIEHQRDEAADAAGEFDHRVPVGAVPLARAVAVEAKARVGARERPLREVARDVGGDAGEQGVGLGRVVPHQAGVVADGEVDLRAAVVADDRRELGRAFADAARVGGAEIGRSASSTVQTRGFVRSR